MKHARRESRRRSERFSVQLPVEVHIRNGEIGNQQELLTGSLLDISQDGIAIQLKERNIDASSDILIILALPKSGKTLELNANLVWINSAFPDVVGDLLSGHPLKRSTPIRYGLNFRLLTPSQIKEIADAIASLVETQHAAPQPERRRYSYYDFYVASLEALQQLHQPKEVDSAAGPIITIEGKSLVSLCSNNTLGLSVNPDVIDAACKATRRYGTSCSSSRLIAGNLSVQVELERRIAEFMGRESAIVYMTGFMANMGLLASLTNNIILREGKRSTGRTDLFCDRQNHVSIIQGCKLCENINGASVRYYLHNDMSDLERALKRSAASRKVIVSEGVFSMIGDIAPVNDIAFLGRKYRALTVLDDAHAIGILGESGRGSTEHLNERGIDIIVGTFSKAFGGVGGFVVAQNELINYLKLQSPTYIFSSALPPGTAAGIVKAIDMVETRPDLRARLWENVRYFKDGVKNAGFTLLESQTHIIPIFIGDERKAITVSQKLFDKGSFIQEIRWPAVAKKRSILRCMPNALHSRQHLDKVIEDLVDVGKSEGIIG